MFGSIKKILSGIVSFLLGFFSSKKSLAGKSDKPRKGNGYFLELEETEAPKELKAVAQSVASATNEVKAKANEVKAKASELVNNKTAAPVQAEATKTEVAPAKVEATKAEPAPTNEQPAKPEVELIQTAEGVKAQLAKPAKPAKTTADRNGKTDSFTFAPKYLIPTTSGSRRRPGANMSSFLDMARQVKSPG